MTDEQPEQLRPSARDLVRRRSRSYRAPETGRHHHIGAAPERQPVLGEDGPSYVGTSRVQLASRTPAQLEAQAARLRADMAAAAAELRFERAGALRDDLERVEAELQQRGAPLVVLLPSPLLGTATWRPVRERLAGRGWRTEVADLPLDARTSPDEVLSALLTVLPEDEDLVLVPHSNAGLYVAAVAEQRSVRGIVFADAGIPELEGETPTAPPAAAGFLAGLADADGRLPPWTQWWPPQEVAALFPDEQTRSRVERQQPRLPLSYFRSCVPAPPGWAALPAAYLAFGDTYAQEVARARSAGWEVVEIPGEHLHALVDPDGVATALDRLLAGVLGRMA